MTITVAMPYYRNQGMLRLHLETWAAYPPEVLDLLRFIIADDCSPEPAEPVIRAARFDGDMSLFRVEVDRPWAWDCARNIAMHHAPDGWCLLTDIDHLLTAENAARLVYTPLKPGRFYTPGRRRAVDGQPYKPHPNSFVIERSLFWEAGGYDEDFTGHYGKDSVWNRQLDLVGQRREWPELELLLYGREVLPDASTSTLGRKGSEYDVALDPVLSKRKKMAHLVKPTSHMRLPFHRVL